MLQPSAVQEKEISQDVLNETGPAKARELLAFWNKHATKWQLPTRGDFRPGNMRAWIDDIAILEYVPQKDDFQVRLEGENIVALTGEDWRGGYARELDCQFSTSLHPAMTMVRMTGQPKLHHLQVFKSDWRNAIRMLLPVVLQKPGKEDVLQIFLAVFPVEE